MKKLGKRLIGFGIGYYGFILLFSHNTPEVILIKSKIFLVTTFIGLLLITIDGESKNN